MSSRLKWVFIFIKLNGLDIRRITHIEQNIPQDKNEKINKFKKDIIQKRKDLYIEEDEDYLLINMDEKGWF